MLIGIFGGTFDPVHLGHKRALDALHQTLPVGRVHWVLSARPPHKESVSASIEHRFAMLELALKDAPHYVADASEIERQAKSYTIDTVELFRQRYPQADLCVIIGADSLLTLPTWHRYQALMASVNWVIMHRPGYPLEVPSEIKPRLVESPAELLQYKHGKVWVFDASDFNISSTQLRHAISTEQTQPASLVNEFLAPQVLSYIQTHKLYKISQNSVVEKSMNSEQIKDQVVDALDDVKGQDINVIDIADISDFADYMVVASGTSDTHVKALARSASDKLRVQGVKPLNEDGSDVGEWVLVDFGDVVLHVMRPEVRDYYDLEKLWDEDVRKMVEQHREERGE